ncbi:uncharacterized protein LOC121306451 isoform X4 [Polyodon spathula]|uniref:uncharacterized protein LOC121306451 isoform X4 n=1 Tax=Polyodon spathula TaxID=7913 RepID=UPI001B7F0484|nr:uncharacterized protein LOC121306451 isoform X4 [Polyodon spathula]
MDRRGDVDLSPIAAPNDYQDNGESKTEDAYETLQFDNPAEPQSRTVTGRYSHTARGLLSSAASQHGCQSSDECWLLHQEKLYYLSTQKGSCMFASHFCAQRQSILAALGRDGEGFLASRTGSRSFWVEPSGGEEDTDFNFESSGDNWEDVLNREQSSDSLSRGVISDIEQKPLGSGAAQSGLFFSSLPSLARARCFQAEITGKKTTT